MYIFLSLLQALDGLMPITAPVPRDRATARMAKLVDAWDLKSPARKGVPVRFRLRAPSISRACTVFLSEPYPELLRNFKYCSAIHFVGVTFLPIRLRM